MSYMYIGVHVVKSLMDRNQESLLCSETLVSDMCHVSELLVLEFGRPVLLCRGRMPRA